VFGISGLGFGVWKVQGSGFMVQGLRFSVKNLGFRV